MRVVLITQSSDSSRQSALLSLAEALAVLGEAVTVVTPRSPAHAVDPRVDVLRLAGSRRGAPGLSLAMTKVVDPLRPDVVHAVDASAAAAWPGCLFSVPPELPSVAGRSAQIRLFRRAMTTAGTVLVPSPEVARELADHWDLQADVLPMGSDAWSAAAHRRVYRRIMRGAAAA